MPKIRGLSALMGLSPKMVELGISHTVRKLGEQC